MGCCGVLVTVDILVTEKRGQRRQVDAGVGLSRQSIVNGLKAAVEDGYLRKQVICQACGGEVEQALVERARSRAGQAETYHEMSVADVCSHCRRKLKSRELVYYGLRWKDDRTPAATPRDIPAKQRGDYGSRLRGVVAKSLSSAPD